MNDLQIAKKVTLRHISKIAEKFGIDPDQIEMYGKYKAHVAGSKTIFFPRSAFVNCTTMKKFDIKKHYSVCQKKMSHSSTAHGAVTQEKALDTT